MDRKLFSVSFRPQDCLNFTLSVGKTSQRCRPPRIFALTCPSVCFLVTTIVEGKIFLNQRPHVLGTWTLWETKSDARYVQNILEGRDAEVETAAGVYALKPRAQRVKSGLLLRNFTQVTRIWICSNYSNMVLELWL